MPGVLTQAIGRQDILLHRGSQERVGVRWEQDSGAGFVPVDLSGWSARLELLSQWGDVWLSLPCTTTADGLAKCTVPWDALTGLSWVGRSSGQWRITGVAPDRHQERLAQGILRID